MELPLVKEYAHIAREKWQEYAQACKKNPGDKSYKMLRNVYHRIYRGQKVIEIGQVIKAGGIHKNYTHAPALAFAPAKFEQVHALMTNSGTLRFCKHKYWWDPFFDLPKFVSPIDKTKLQDGYHWHWSAPVPIMPPNVRPPVIKDTHIIIWEVTSWKQEAPIDPWLAELIPGTKSYYVLLNGWELTDLEQSVMNVKLRS